MRHSPSRTSLIVTLALALLVAVVPRTGPAAATEAKTQVYFEKEAAFLDVFQDLQDAIVNRGLIVDYVGHIDQMLERTSKASGSVTETGSRSPYLAAKYVQFCSAKLTHESVSANPYNIAVCPYVIFAFEPKDKPGHVVVGYRRPVPGPSKLTKKAFAKIEELLLSIVKEVTAE